MLLTSQLLVTKKIRECLCVLALCFTSQAALAGNLEIVDGNLVDNSTGLIWKGLTSSALEQLPASPNIDNSRIVYGEELFGNGDLSLGGLFSYTPLGPQTISITSDIYKAFSFFASSLNGTQLSNYKCNNGTTCSVSGWYLDETNTDYSVYNHAIFEITPISTLINSARPATSFRLTSTYSLGDYKSSEPCSLCASTNGAFFMVSSVPEPSSTAFLVAGFALLFVRKRHLKTNS